MRPERGTYPEYYNNYIPLVNLEDVIVALESNWTDMNAFISAIPQDMENYAYAPDKWTIKQMIQHLVDTERVFAYRALRFARKDPQQPLSFEENEYAKTADVSNRSLSDILQEFETVRKASLSLFKSFSPATLLNKGNTAFGTTTVLALGFFICGHAIHHVNVTKERYLKK